MRIAITANGGSPDSPVDGRFTTARDVIVFDAADAQWETMKFSLWSRQQKYSGQIRASMLKEKGVGALISGGVDPVSFKELAKRDIDIYQAPECLVREAAEMLAAGQLRILQIPDAIDVTRLVKKAAIKF
jgi:predicted Fe-Mo cluster-binding NifX family protein